LASDSITTIIKVRDEEGDLELAIGTNEGIIFAQLIYSQKGKGL